MNAQPFLFGEDLGTPGRNRRAADARANEAKAEIEREAFGRGREAGRAEALGEQPGRLAAAGERIAGGILLLLEEAERRTEAVEEDALAFFETLARTLAGDALERLPLAGIAEAARESFRHARGAPHLAVRVHESLVEPVDAMLRTMARERGFEGRVIVLGEDAVPPGDARMDWADGGIAHDHRRRDEAVAEVMARVRGSGDSAAPHTMEFPR